MKKNSVTPFGFLEGAAVLDADRGGWRLHHVEERLAAGRERGSVHRPAGRRYPGTSLVRAGCTAVTVGSFEGDAQPQGPGVFSTEG